LSAQMWTATTKSVLRKWFISCRKCRDWDR